MWPISARFKSELGKEVQSFRVHMHVLDTDMQPIAGGQFHDAGDQSDSDEDLIIDGNVDVDVTRQVRRTFTATMLNPDGRYSPGSDWAGMFYVNRIIRLYRGLDYGDEAELVPIGTFMIDHVDVNAERGMSALVLSGSDLWKKLIKSEFSNPASWAAGTPINTAIKAIADAAGITSYNLDPLSERAAAGKQFSTTFSVERGDNRGDAVRAIADAYGIDAYLDPLGVFTTQDFNTPSDGAVVWEYIAETSNNLLTAQSAFTDEKLYNSVLVLGTADHENVIVSYRANQDPSSPTNTTRLGDRTLKFESDLIGTQAAADAASLKLFYDNVVVSDDITLDVICNPAFEGNDVIRVIEDEFTKLHDSYRLKALTVPMSTSKQVLRMQANISLGIP